MSTTADRLRARLVTPVADDLGVTVCDIEDSSGTCGYCSTARRHRRGHPRRRLPTHQPGHGRGRIIRLGRCARGVQPGLERKLRTAAHSAPRSGGGAGQDQARPGVADRRIDGVVAAADDRTVTVATSTADRAGRSPRRHHPPTPCSCGRPPQARDEAHRPACRMLGRRPPAIRQRPATSRTRRPSRNRGHSMNPEMMEALDALAESRGISKDAPSPPLAEALRRPTLKQNDDYEFVQ